MEKKRILCLDLDGTVRQSKSGKTFIEGPDDVELIPGMKEWILHYRSLGYLVYGISNQGGIAHGFKTHAQVEAEMKATLRQLDMGFVNLLYCPFDQKGKVDGYNFRSLSRKPNYGMLVLVEFDLHRLQHIPDWDNSLFVGDRPEDEECAKSAGIPFMWAHDFVKQLL